MIALCTRVRGRGFLRTSGVKGSRKSVSTAFFLLVYLAVLLLSWETRRRRRLSGVAERVRQGFLRKQAPLVPDSGQRVRLRAGRGRWRGRFRVVSYPYTHEAGVVVRVAEEGRTGTPSERAAVP